MWKPALTTISSAMRMMITFSAAALPRSLRTCRTAWRQEQVSRQSGWRPVHKRFAWTPRLPRLAGKKCKQGQADAAGACYNGQVFLAASCTLCASAKSKTSQTSLLIPGYQQRVTGGSHIRYCRLWFWFWRYKMLLYRQYTRRLFEVLTSRIKRDSSL